MNPDTYIHNDLGSIWVDKNVRSGDKITLYEFDDDEEQMNKIEFIRFLSRLSNDYNLNLNDLLSRYVPDIESKKKDTYTFMRTEKCRGDRWAVLLTENGEERHINVSDTYMSFYSINLDSIE